jgi:hypothetical protein
MTKQETPNKSVPGKIGKVTFKSKNITVFPQARLRNALKQEILEKVIEMLDEAPEDLDGYVVMAWDKSGDQDYYALCRGKIPSDYFGEFAKVKINKAILMHETGLTFIPPQENEDDDDGDTTT